MNKREKVKFSILGDSISTLQGCNPAGCNVFYEDILCEELGILNPQDTWWGQVIEHFDGELLMNDSYSGSLVCSLNKTMPFPTGTFAGTMFPAGCSRERTHNLHKGDVTPDVIIVYMGTNDYGFGMELYPIDGYGPESGFTYAYPAMLASIQDGYPSAEIWCCTICPRKEVENPPYAFGLESIPMDRYNDVIRKTAREYGCKLIDLYRFGIEYETFDGLHPTKQGMQEIAEMVIKSCAE